jgi:hypothetical protein
MSSQTYSEPLFDIFSFARRGSGRRDRLSPGEIQQVARTVRRTPEVMVKVLSKPANTLTAVRKHLEYIGRCGDLDLKTDDGERLRDGHDLVEDWDLDLDQYRRNSDLTATQGKEPVKLVHKMIFSMPAGTPPEKVLTAVKNSAREEFNLKHRYAMVLHTDEPHPHVHMVVKAVSEQGKRLNIRKGTLADWRRQFARHLRAQGIAANATDRFVRGETKPRKLDGIYRPMRDPKWYSTHMESRMELVMAELLRGNIRAGVGKSRLVQTRREVERGWRAVSDILLREGQPELASQIERFVNQMSPPLTEKEQLAAALIERTREPRAGEFPTPGR